MNPTQCVRFRLALCLVRGLRPGKSVSCNSKHANLAGAGELLLALWMPPGLLPARWGGPLASVALPLKGQESGYSQAARETHAGVEEVGKNIPLLLVFSQPTVQARSIAG